MSKWEMVKLGDVCRPKQWKTISTQMLCDAGYPVYGANGLIGYYSEYTHEKETLLVTCRGATCGSLNICQPFSYVNGNAMALDNLSTDINIVFLYFYLINRGFQDVISGSAQPQIIRSNIEKIQIPLPPFDEQKKIADELDKISSLISLRKNQIEKIDLLVKAKFIEMFGDIKSNSNHWNIKAFTDFAIIDTRMVKDFNKYADYPHIGIDCIQKDTGEICGFKTVKQDNVISGKYLFSDKHLIYSKIRPNLNKVAMPSFDGVCSADAYPILPRKNVCNREFLVQVLRSQYFLDYILAYSSRTNLPKVNKKQVEGFYLPCPPYELQNQFAEYVEKTEKIKGNMQKGLEKLEVLYKSRMQEYFG